MTLTKRAIPFVLTLLLLTITAKTLSAQNLQIHYDHNRQCITSTVEMFRPDSFGSTYFFVDMDFQPKMTGTLWKIIRELCFWNNTPWECLSIQLHYTGGLHLDKGSFNNAFMTGLTYSWKSDDRLRTWSLSAVYKYIPGTVGLDGNPSVHNFQLSGNWKIEFLKRWCTFNGFVTFWKEARPWFNSDYVFLSEPQFWVNLNKIPGWDNVHLSIGTEVELSVNYFSQGFACCPTAAVKWTF